MRRLLGSSTTAFSSFVAPLAFLAFGSLSACSSNTTTPTASPFQGRWSCTVVDNLTFTTPANGEPESNTTSPLITIVADISGNLSVTGLVDAGATCPLNFASSGTKATLASGQSCTSGAISLTYGDGSASVTGSALSATIAYTFSGTVAARPQTAGRRARASPEPARRLTPCTRNGT